MFHGYKSRSKKTLESCETIGTNARMNNVCKIVLDLAWGYVFTLFMLGSLTSLLNEALIPDLKYLVENW